VEVDAEVVDERQSAEDFTGHHRRFSTGRLVEVGEFHGMSLPHSVMIVPD
jgi:hypothetical protein